MRNSYRSILAGVLEKGLPKIISRALLWSVYKVKEAPYRYRWKCSMPHTIARRTFSVWEYRLSVGVRARLAYAIMCGGVDVPGSH